MNQTSTHIKWSLNDISNYDHLHSGKNNSQSPYQNLKDIFPRIVIFISYRIELILNHSLLFLITFLSWFFISTILPLAYFSLVSVAATGIEPSTMEWRVGCLTTVLLPLATRRQSAQNVFQHRHLASKRRTSFFQLLELENN